MTKCERGQHGPLIEGEPQDYGDCVNVDETCSLCGKHVSVSSWRKDAWLAHVEKQKRRGRGRQGRLF